MKEIDHQNANNSPNENESSKEAAINVGTAQNKDSERSAGPNLEANSNDKVREILGQQKLTPEQRESKRRELIEKQKEARKRAAEARLRIPNENEGGSAIVANTNTTQQFEPREDMILQAVTFLSSPIVRNSDEDKKFKFLLSKGLTQAEIDIAKDRVNKEETLAPPVPPRTYQMAVARTPLWKRLIFILLITVTAIIFAKQQLYSHQVNLFRRFNETLSTFLSLNKSTSRSKPVERRNFTDDDDESPTPYDIDEISTPPALLAPLATDLSGLTERLSIHQQTLSKCDAISDLQLSLSSLAAYLSANVYSYSRSPPNDRDSPVSQVRSEIRSLKSLLVNRRNFPKIPPVPVYSAQSQITSSQPSQQEVNISNENVE
ncbi:5253_t:CDS:2 [Funneliformis mosseae]|uniref:Peroxisomal membrane protein PEX14 n=1 Tax=Funneliformis mosseae TaxID=27381 RepID=A0A9N8YXK3_FUNMO|nr:5253_t:CDS:2 [Funneliformis mosseae]